MQLSTSNHPQADGLSENTIKQLENHRRLFCSHNQQDWATLLPAAQRAFNTRVIPALGRHPALGTSPFHNFEPRDLHDHALQHHGTTDPTSAEPARLRASGAK